jgi:PAS domain S-box-containing protein
VWPLQAFGSEPPWLKSYPAVIAVALYGGLYAGLLTTALDCLSVTLLWPLFADHPFIENRFDLLEMAVFALICSFISYLAKAVHHSQKALKRAESAAKASAEREQFIRSIIKDIPNMIGYWDRDLRCRYANNSYREWFGKSPEKIIGITFRDLAGEHLFALNEPHIRRVLAGKPQRFERTLNKAGGDVGHIIGHYIPNFDADGIIKGFVTQTANLSALGAVGLINHHGKVLPQITDTVKNKVILRPSIKHPRTVLKADLSN